MKLSKIEKHTVIAALRYFDAHRSEAIKETRGLFEDGNSIPLFTGEIDELIINIDHHDKQPTPVGAFNFDDYKEQSESDGYDLTDEQIADLMESSRRKFDASVGMGWDIMSLHISMWADDNDIQKTNTEGDD